MGFIETLVPEAPALIEKNTTKCMFIKSFIVNKNIRFRTHPIAAVEPKKGRSKFITDYYVPIIFRL